MTSQINPSNIDATYPVAGQPNNTQGFRDNFTATQTNFNYAATEITDLQNKAVLKAALTGTTLDNNMNDALLYAAKIQDFSATAVNLTTTSGPVTVDYTTGHYQSLSPSTGSVTLGFTKWPAANNYGYIRLRIYITNTAYTVTLPAAATQGIAGIQGLSGSTITFGATGYYEFGFSTVDGGTTITVFDLNRPLSYYTNPVTIASTSNSTSTTTGALKVAGGVGIAGNLYVGGDIFGNVSITDLNLGNVSASGYISATGNITGGNILGNFVGSLNPATISVTGNITGGNVLTTGNVTTGNITAGNLSLSGNVLSAINSTANITTTGNISGGNINAVGLSLSGNVVNALNVNGNITSTGFYIGDGGFLSNITAVSNLAVTQIANGTSVLAVQGTSGNVTFTIGGTSNVAVITSSGALVSGYMSATANVIGGNILTAGMVSATANVIGGNVVTLGNITSGNLLTSGIVSATANIIGGNVLTTGLISATANITADKLNAAGLSLTGNVLSDLNVNGNTTASGNVQGSNLLTSGIVSATANIIGGNIVTGGLVTVVGNVISGNINTSGLISGTGNIQIGNVSTAGLISATGNIIGGNINSGGSINAAGNISVTGNVISGNLTTGALVVALGNITGSNLNATGTVLAQSATAIPTGGAVGAGYVFSTTANFGVFFGSGAPTLSAAKGSLYLRSDGTTTNDRMYVNTNGSTTWTAVITAA